MSSDGYTPMDENISPTGRRPLLKHIQNMNSSYGGQPSIEEEPEA